jgi:hypothetical protein
MCAILSNKIDQSTKFDMCEIVLTMDNLSLD